jgi:hypothetical protein
MAQHKTTIVLLTAVLIGVGMSLLVGSALYLAVLKLEPGTTPSEWTSAMTICVPALAGGALLAIIGLVIALKRTRSKQRRVEAAKPEPEAAPSLRTTQQTKLTRGSAAELFSTVQAYLDLEMFSHAEQAARELLERFPRSLESIEINKRYREIKWLADSSESGPRMSKESIERIVGVSEGERKQLFENIKTYIEMEMWDIAVEQAQAFVRDFGDTREGDLLAKHLPNLRANATAAREGRKIS